LFIGFVHNNAVAIEDTQMRELLDGQKGLIQKSGIREVITFSYPYPTAFRQLNTLPPLSKRGAAVFIIIDYPGYSGMFPVRFNYFTAIVRGTVVNYYDLIVCV
jgi:hypothetical protein